ncbi:MAG: DUF4430 domain-containing protein [Methanothrix sp.]|nr:DUF4430 domain-containing protein [Methanothrix sp.]
MKHLALALFCVFLLTLTTASAEVTVQITVFCNGCVVYDNAVTVTGSNPTAWDAIKASDVGYVPTNYGDWIFINSIAGCGGSWGPAFYVNGAESDVGVNSYYIDDGDHLQFIGPNNGGPTAGILYLAEVPDVVTKGEGFRVKVMEKSAYSYGGYDRPSAGATVTIGNETFDTGSNGYTEEITLEYDAYYCVAAEKGGYVATYHFYGLPYIQCGAGGPYICSVTGEGAKRGNIKYDEASSISGEGFCSCRSYFENYGGKYPARSTKVYQKGSGSYDAEKIVKQRPSGIDLSESTEMKYNPTTVKAYNRVLSYKSNYEDSTYQKNYREATESSERYRQLDFLKKMSYYNNTRGINYSFTADFQGIAELSARTLEDEAFLDWKEKAQPKEESIETYIGNFLISRRGFLPMGGNDETDCEEECKWNCKKHCMEDEGYSEDYCEDYCGEYCEDYCENESTYEDYELLPCCSGGWFNMTKADQTGHSAKGIFDCSCKNTAAPVLIGKKASSKA